MKVYRYLSQKELDKILIGNTCYFSRVNTHNYNKDIKYLHFYKNPKHLRFARELHNKDYSDYYFCEFNIPAIHLIKHAGHGTYDTGGYDCDRIKVLEFALPVEKFNANYLKTYTLDKRHHEECHQLDNLVPISFSSALFEDEEFIKSEQ